MRRAPGTCALTSGRGGLWVREQDNTALRSLYELGERRLGPFVGVDLAAKARQRDRVTGLGRGCACSRNNGIGRGLAIGLCGQALDGIHFLLDDLLHLVHLGLGRSLLLRLGRAHRCGRGRLALAEFDHGDASRLNPAGRRLRSRMQVGDGQCEGGDHGREREVVGNRARMKTWRLHTLHDSSTEPGRSATYKKGSGEAETACECNRGTYKNPRAAVADMHPRSLGTRLSHIDISQLVPTCFSCAGALWQAMRPDWSSRDIQT